MSHMMDAMTLAVQKTYERDVERHERTAKTFGYAETSEGSGIITSYLGTLTTHIQTQLLDPSSVHGHALEKPFLLVVQDLDPAKIALATLTGLLNAIVTRKTLLKTQLSLGHLIAGELWAADLIKHAPKEAAKVLRAAKARRGSLQGRQREARSLAERAADFRLKKHWETDELNAAGNCLINWALAALPDVFVLTELSDGSSIIDIRDEAVEKGLAAAREVMLANPVFVPTLEQPKPWTAFRAGGYWDERTEIGAPLVRTHHRETRRIIEREMAAGTMQPHVDGLNVLMSVPWKINTRVLEVLEQCRQLDIPVEDGLPSKPLDELPALTEQQKAEWSKERQKQHHRERFERKEHNLGLKRDRILLGKDIDRARDLATASRFYTPFNCDWRGRLIPLTHFAFSREDRVRGLFMFAQGLPIGTEGLRWLKIHVANSGDFEKVSKRSFEERVAWVDRSLSLIELVAREPLHPSALAVWTKADCPFVFLAACIELSAAVAAGPSYVTHLPISFDGTCSGLQHLCAMTRSEEGRYVNLTPCDIPEDVYGLIAETAKAYAEADLSNSEKASVAALCLKNGIDRKLLKQNVMTYFYSAKERCMISQHVDGTMRPLSIKVLKGEIVEHPYAHPHDTRIVKNTTETYTVVGLTAAEYLAALAQRAIEEKLPGPAKAMKFLRALSNRMAHEVKPLEWTTPAGFTVSNRYHLPTMKCVDLYFGNKPYKMHVAKGFDPKIDKGGAARGVAPNFVHSMDACHLFLTVRNCAAEGITSIATVHDSFGCLAPQATRFNAIIRETFVEMYTSHDVLAEVHERARQALDVVPKGFPKLLPKGSLNIQEVLNAPFTFA